jgi:hypothetical protein
MSTHIRALDLASSPKSTTSLEKTLLKSIPSARTIIEIALEYRKSWKRGE